MWDKYKYTYFLSSFHKYSQPALTCLKSMVETPEQCVKSVRKVVLVVAIVNFQQISHIVLVFSCLTLTRKCWLG